MAGLYVGTTWNSTTFLMITRTLFTCAHPMTSEDSNLHTQKVRNKVGNLDIPLLASVKVFGNWFVRLMSVAPVPRSVETRVSFLETPHLWPTQSLWKHFKGNGYGK